MPHSIWVASFWTCMAASVATSLAVDQAPAASRRAAVVAPFLEWFSDLGGSFTATVRPAPAGGLAIYATAPLRANSRVAQVPGTLVMDYEGASASTVGALVVDVYARAQGGGGGGLPPRLARLVESDMAPRSHAIGMLLHYEYFYGRAASRWRPYLDILPPPDGCRALPLFWSPAEAALAAEAELVAPESPDHYTAGSQFVADVTDLHREALWSRLPEVYGDVSDPAVLERLSAELRWAIAIVNSRQYGATGGGGSQEGGTYAALVPLIDLANHDSRANVLFTYEATAKEQSSRAARAASASLDVGQSGSSLYVTPRHERATIDRIILSPPWDVATGGEIPLKYHGERHAGGDGGGDK